MRDIEVSGEPVELYKLLKLAGMASSGGEAKSVVAEGRVSVNGSVETRKRKKIFSGDIVGFGKEEIRIQLSRPSSATQE
ncbi:MAG: RNA-binding S4 domain-containing protein [Nitrospirota bacterium]|nr:RNA-binding S4 domain-containing protein [Nitrospirota bacterium]